MIPSCSATNTRLLSSPACVTTIGRLNSRFGKARSVLTASGLSSTDSPAVAELPHRTQESPSIPQITPDRIRCTAFPPNDDTAASLRVTGIQLLHAGRIVGISHSGGSLPRGCSRCKHRSFSAVHHQHKQQYPCQLTATRKVRQAKRRTTILLGDFRWTVMWQDGNCGFFNCAGRRETFANDAMILEISRYQL